MFSHRRNSQKPGAELYAAFKQFFPDVGPGSTPTSSGLNRASAERSAPLSETLINGPTAQRGFDTVDDCNEVDATPKPFGDTWRLTPYFTDADTLAFSGAASQPPGYYTPTPGGFNAIYHSQAGDLHTPGMGMNTPLSMPHILHDLHDVAAALQLGDLQPHLLRHPQLIHHPLGHHQRQQQQHQHHQQTYAPHQSLQHEESGFVVMDDYPQESTPQQNEMVVPSTAQGGTQTSMADVPSKPKLFVGSNKYALSFGEGKSDSFRFRFHTALSAPTAMIKHSDEIPVTYLNKGQAYTLSIFDTKAPLMQLNGPVRYRSFVRISFDHEQQRAHPGACWQLWKTGRGSNEAHKRGGKLLAVEYVDVNQGGDDAIRKPQVELEHVSFDGFAVNWCPNPAPGVPDCSISVRFNFLSTDFSHSKGTTGIPVRLCAKTELVGLQANESNGPEICFSKVKLFRDHGAERKLSNDVAHVKKTIDKLKQQIAQTAAGLDGSGKRKRSGSGFTGKAAAPNPGKAMKRKRTRNVDLDNKVGRSAAQEDLHMKLVSMQDMFSSTRPISVLYLPGEREDDPDLHPVTLPGDDVIDTNIITRTETWESKASVESPRSYGASYTSRSSSLVKPKQEFSELQQSTIFEAPDEDGTAAGRQRSPGPVKVSKIESDKGQGTLFALDVNKNYKSPKKGPVAPVVCLYVRQADDAKEYYRAVYLVQRTVRDLVDGISQKFNFDPHRVTSVFHLNAKGLPIVVDEDFVRELPEGQDMQVEFAPGAAGDAVKPEIAQGTVAESMVDGIIDPANTSISDPLEIWLSY